ncbi:MAG TPA: RNA-binding transcriptional accessory protein, partial [Clostridiales bacterium]|nr:RNA-binding transcriptional accessory protein [Clostridiales bacterium]
MDIILTLSNELNIKKEQVVQTVKLIDQGNTVPFIARYRKEVTGGLDDVVLRKLFDRLTYLRNLDERRETVKRLIDERGKLTGNIAEQLDKSTILREIEDIYRPFKPKKKTRATEAKRKGLETFADIILSKNTSGKTIGEIASDYVNPEKEVANAEEAIQGALDIIAETFSDSPGVRDYVRTRMLNTAAVKCTQKKDEESVYDMYYDYTEPVKTIANHRVLAINRGEKEGYLNVGITVDDARIINGLKLRLFSNEKGECVDYMEKALEDAYKRLILPALENEIRADLLAKAQDKAMTVFSANLNSLLMQSPVKGKIVLGVDPAYRTGCKVAVIDSTGKVLDTTVIYPTPPMNKTEEAKKVLSELIEKHKPEIIAIGNGTASGETENFVADFIRESQSDLVYVIVNEAGASVYSASELGTKEFPQFDVALRSAVSIARRLQDPMAELVKIPPESIGVGQY